MSINIHRQIWHVLNSNEINFACEFHMKKIQVKSTWNHHYTWNSHDIHMIIYMNFTFTACLMWKFSYEFQMQLLSVNVTVVITRTPCCLNALCFEGLASLIAIAYINILEWEAFCKLWNHIWHYVLDFCVKPSNQFA